MLLAWGFTLGLLTFCVVMLVRHPQVVSVLTNGSGNNKNNKGESEEPERSKADD